MMYFGQPYFGEYYFQIGSGNVTVFLTGVSATGGVGTVAVKSSVNLTGVSITGLLGVLSVAHSLALHGIGISGIVGTLTPNFFITPTGVVGTVAIANPLVTSRTVALLGVNALISLGRIRGFNANYYFRDVLRPNRGSDVFPNTDLQTRSYLNMLLETVSINNSNDESS